jgi:uncharacterized protein
VSAARVRIRLTPRAGRDELTLREDGVVLVRVTAPPVDGRANAAACALVAKRAGVAKSRVSVATGARSRDKVLAVEGLTEAELRRALR